MSHYTGMQPNEIFVGNYRMEDWPAEHLFGLKTARLGEQALDINGKKIDPSYMRPLFIGREELGEYNKIMMLRTFPLKLR